jgi:bacterioferritin
MLKEQLIEILQKILEFEYTDMFVYNSEAEFFKKKIKNSENLVKMYKNFAIDELTHADIISQRIIFLNGFPRWEYKIVSVSNSVHETLRYHIEREIQAIRIYTDLLNNTEDRKFKVVIKGIISNEKEHLEHLTKIFNNLK